MMPSSGKSEAGWDIPTIAVSKRQVTKFVESIKRFEWVFDTFKDPLMYPGDRVSRTLAANFFFFMVAIDHRTHPPGAIFRGKVRDVELTGAELLWTLAKIRLDHDPMFFSPQHLAHIRLEEVLELFTVHHPRLVHVAGPEERAKLWRDCASKLEEHFGGSILTLIRSSGGRLIREDEMGFLQLLKIFEAYKDPLNKKSFLLVKFLERRRFLRIKDAENLHVLVEHI